ncbi:MAG: hypothetical protein K0R75_200 [Paenibacillaceae bacterium]|nr:hypothetical protein [Paenibacillaceae bacterium]
MNLYVCYRCRSDVELLLGGLRVEHGTIPPANSHRFFIVNWHGSVPDNPESVSVLNRPAAIGRALDPAVRCRWLSTQGVDTVNPDDAGNKGSAPNGDRFGAAIDREFYVPVFHLEPLTVFATRTMPAARGLWLNGADAGIRELDAGYSGYYAQKAKQLAVRAIYALGLDFGGVRVRVLSDGGLAVVDVEPAPKLDKRLAELYAQAILRLAEETDEDERVAKTVLLGADPEFVLRKVDGEIVFASLFLDKSGKAGCDAIVLPDRSKQYPLAELRPSPSSEPRELIHNLRRTMEYAARLIGDDRLEWVAGGMPAPGFPLGGHIHVSGVKLNSRLLRTFDNYMALPLILLEDRATANRRPQYGFLGDFRLERHGGFEYRTLPSWLVSPRIAAGVLSLARLLVMHYRRLRQNPLDDFRILRSYYIGDKVSLLPTAERIWAELERLPDYANNKEDLDYIKGCTLRMESWDAERDFRGKWKVPTRS